MARALCFVMVVMALFLAPSYASNCTENSTIPTFSLSEAIVLGSTLDKLDYEIGTGNITRTDNQLHIQGGTFSVIAVRAIAYREDVAINLSTGLVEEWKV